MQEWMILKSPALLLCYGAALLCFLLDRKWQASHGILTWVGGILGVTATAALLLEGGSLWEAAAGFAALLLPLIGGKET